MTEQVISADSHVTVTEEKFLSYVPKKFHDDLMGLQGTLFRQSPETLAPQKRRNAVVAAAPPRRGLAPGAMSYPAAGRAGGHDPYERLKDMDIDQVLAEVLYGDVNAGGAWYSLDDEACTAVFQASNNAHLEFASANPERLIPVYQLPLHDLEVAVKEVQRIANEGARAVQVPLYPEDANLAPYSDPAYDGLWSAIEEIGMPISLHLGMSNALNAMAGNDVTGVMPPPISGVMVTLSMGESIAKWIANGTLDRHPDLRLVYVEAGLGWIPHLLERIDNIQVRHGWERQGLKLKEGKASSYWFKNMAATFEEDEFGIANRDRLGVGNLMWASDYPHSDSTWPDSQAAVEKQFEAVPETEKRKMVYETVKALYRLQV